MANIKKEFNSAGIPGNYNRSNPIPLDKTEVWYSLEAAEDYAKNNSTAYVGQTIKVVDEAKGAVETFVITDTSGKLEPIGGTPGFAYYSAEAEKASGYIKGGELDRKLTDLLRVVTILADVVSVKHLTDSGATNLGNITLDDVTKTYIRDEILKPFIEKYISLM